MSRSRTSPTPLPEVARPPVSEVPFGANEVRLNGREWLLTLLLASVVMAATPWLWPRIERVETGPDYRIPYELSNDYWLYGQRVRQVADSRSIPVVGDSVVWGEYVRPDGTLSHFLNREAGPTDLFVNLGVNAFFPLALEGLLRYYGQPMRRQRVILQCNVLWMTSPKADLSTDKEEPFNHARLVPQFIPRIPCYRATAEERLSAVVEREADCMGWVGHLQSAYFAQKSIPKWTLETEGANPSRGPNAYRSPLGRITLTVPAGPQDDPQRGPGSPRHKPWSTNSRGTTVFDWVPLASSSQWQAFQRVVALLRERGNDVLVLVGPFNEHLMAEESRMTYRALREEIVQSLRQHGVAQVVPETLPSALYADASHPLTEGYELLAKRMLEDAAFREWLSHPSPALRDN